MVIDYFYLKNKWNIKPKGIIHVGAHHGEELGTYLRDTDVTDIVFFEASRSTFNYLKQNIDNIQKPNHIHSITAYPFGLGSEEKEVEFYVASNGQSSSVLKPKLHVSQHPEVIFNGIEKISIKTLDSFNLTEYDYINMDVQGYELEVLKGAHNTLKNVKWIYTEVNNAPLYENCVLIDELDNFLLSYGFRREDTSWCRVHGNWGDALYIKN